MCALRDKGNDGRITAVGGGKTVTAAVEGRARLGLSKEVGGG